MWDIVKVPVSGSRGLRSRVEAEGSRGVIAE